MTDEYYDKYIKYKKKYKRLTNQELVENSAESYKKRYKEYKKKYIKLKQNYYFVHGSSSIYTVEAILEDGYLRPGADVDIKYRKLSGGEPQHYIYMNIFFEDLKNLSFMRSVSLIFHPKIMREYGMVFNKGWNVGPSNKELYSIHVNSNDSDNVINNKIKKIRKFIKNPESLPLKVREQTGLYHHEILFNKPIELKDNLLGIVCNQCSDDILDKIKKILNDKQYKNIKILTHIEPLPSLNELLSSL